MGSQRLSHTRCLTHQLDEDQMSPVGLVCPQCKQRLYTEPPRGRCLTFWESQPAAYSAEGEPCFVYTLRWDDFRIRSLHPPDSQDDPRGKAVRSAAGASRTAARRWQNRLTKGHRRPRRPHTDTEFRDGTQPDADDAV